MHSRWSCVHTREEEGRRAGVTCGSRAKSNIRHAACGIRIRTRQGSYTTARRHSKTTAFTFLTGRGRNKIVAHSQITALPHARGCRFVSRARSFNRNACAQEHRCRSSICSLSVRRHRVWAAPFGTAWLPRSWRPADPGTGRHTQVGKPILARRAACSRHSLQKGGSSFTCNLFAGLGSTAGTRAYEKEHKPQRHQRGERSYQGRPQTHPKTRTKQKMRSTQPAAPAAATTGSASGGARPLRKNRDAANRGEFK